MEILDENSLFSQWSEKWRNRKNIGMHYKYIKSTNGFVKYLNDYFGDLPIKEVRLMHIEDMITDLSICNPHTHKPSSRKLLKNLKTTASAIFRFAINNCDNLSKNPAEYAEIPTYAPKSERTSVSIDTQKLIFNTPHRARLPALIMMCCGLRVGELVALTWESIDWNKQCIKVNKSVYRSKSNVFELKKGTKNGKSRNVPIP